MPNTQNAKYKKWTGAWVLLACEGSGQKWRKEGSRLSSRANAKNKCVCMFCCTRLIESFRRWCHMKTSARLNRILDFTRMNKSSGHQDHEGTWAKGPKRTGLYVCTWQVYMGPNIYLYVYINVMCSCTLYVYIRKCFTCANVCVHMYIYIHI